MSLRPMDENKPMKQKARRTPQFDSIPELDDLFNDFDSPKRKELGLPEPTKETEFEKFSKPEPVKKKTLPVFDEEIEEEEETEENLESHSENTIYDEELQEESNGEEPHGFPTFEMPEDSEENDTEFEEEFEENGEFQDDSDFSSDGNLEDEKDLPDEFEDLDEDVEDDEDFRKIEEKEEQKEEKQVPAKKGDSKFKELDEEKVKEFFKKLIPKKGSKATKEKQSKPRGENPIKKGIKLSKKALTILISIAIVLVIVVAVFFFSGKGYSLLNELSFDVQENLTISNIKPGENPEFLATNNGDMSASFFFYVTLEEKGMIPFMGSKIECESDIVDVITGGEQLGTMKCSVPLEEGKKYKYSEATVSEI